MHYKSGVVPPPSVLNPLIKIQKKAIRLITLSHYNSHTEPLFKKLDILPLNFLIELTKLQTMQNFIYGLLPESIMEDWELLRNRRQDQVNVVLRNHDDIFVPMARTTHCERLPFISFPKTWNSFNEPTIKIIINKLEFKFKLKQYFLGKLSENYLCTRLLCPRCHLNT